LCKPSQGDSLLCPEQSAGDTTPEVYPCPKTNCRIPLPIQPILFLLTQTDHYPRLSPSLPLSVPPPLRISACLHSKASSKIRSMHLPQMLSQVISSNKATHPSSFATRNGTSIKSDVQMHLLMTFQLMKPLIMLCATENVTMEALTWSIIISRRKNSNRSAIAHC